MRFALAALLLVASVALAEDAKGSADHPLFTRMPGFTIDGYTVTAFDQERFRINAGGDMLPVEGKKTRILYNRGRDAAGAAPASLEIRRNHQAAIKALGGEVLFDDANDTVLKLVKGTRETWARVSPAGGGSQYTLLVLEKGVMQQVVTASATPSSNAAPTDAAGFVMPADEPGSVDHPLFSRMPHFRLNTSKVTAFDKFEFTLDASGKRQAVEGKHTRILYSRPAKAPGSPPSSLEIIRNFQNAIKAIGGEVVFETANETVLKLVKGSAETWARLSPGGGGTQYELEIIEKGSMEQAVRASDISTALEAQGRIALYGILFDFNKADLKAESEPTLKVIADYLKSAPTISVYVVGHTDNVGEHPGNLKLSRARAEAVRAALTSRHGIDGKRIVADGVAAMCPVATNGNEAGRALNRRVEIVKR